VLVLASLDPLFSPPSTTGTLQRYPDCLSSGHRVHVPAKSLHIFRNFKKRHPNLQLHTIVSEPESRSIVLNIFKFEILCHCAYL
jgi:hypothetical protein